MNYTVIKNLKLDDFNTMRLSATAAVAVFPHTTNGLRNALDTYKGRKIIVLGGGSNSIFTKAYYDDTYVFLFTPFLNHLTCSDDMIEAGSGVALSRLSWFALENGYGNLAFLEDIPGTVGGAVVMNAGTQAKSVGEQIKYVRYYDYAENTIVKVKNAGAFHERGSDFGPEHGIIIGAEFSAVPGEYESVLDNMLELKKQRWLKQPRNFPNAGSVFKRPYVNGKPQYVWTLLEECGLRGYRLGGASISEKHPGFIVNRGRCTYEDLERLIELCEDRVYEKFGITLELEWKLI